MERKNTDTEPFEKVSTIEEIIAENLIVTVKGITPEQIKSAESRKSILETYENALDLIARGVIKDAQEEDIPPIYLYERNIWDLTDFARTMLTNPLPRQAFEFEVEEQTPPLPSEIADYINWWLVLTKEQKQAFSEIIGLDLTKADTFVPPSGEREVVHVIAQAKEIMTVAAQDDMPETNFYPTLIWIPHEGQTGHIGLTALPVVS